MVTFHPRRPIGRTGFKATSIGVGDLADRTLPPAEQVRTLRRALDAGLNVVDTAPAYEDGLSEQLVGRALQGRREGVFLIDKVDLLGKPVAPQVDASLERLGLEQVDLFVFHGVSAMPAWEHLLQKGGGMDQLGDCVARGKARFVGISSHDPEVLRAAVESRRCDVVMFPVGPFADRRYVEQILPLARHWGVGTICFKAFGAGKLLGDTEGYGRPLPGRGSEVGGAVGEPLLPRLRVEECVRFALTCDPDVELLGLSNAAEQDAAFAAVRSFTPMSKPEMELVRSRAAEAVKEKGPVWWNP